MGPVGLDAARCTAPDDTRFGRISRCPDPRAVTATPDLQCSRTADRRATARATTANARNCATSACSAHAAPQADTRERAATANPRAAIAAAPQTNTRDQNAAVNARSATASRTSTDDRATAATTTAATTTHNGAKKRNHGCATAEIESSQSGTAPSRSRAFSTAASNWLIDGGGTSCAAHAELHRRYYNGSPSALSANARHS